MRDLIFPMIETEGYYTVTVKMLLFDRPKLFKYLTYKVKNSHTIKAGQSCRVRTPKGERQIIVMHIDPVKRDTTLGIDYKFLDEVAV